MDGQTYINQVHLLWKSGYPLVFVDTHEIKDVSANTQFSMEFKDDVGQVAYFDNCKLGFYDCKTKKKLVSGISIDNTLKNLISEDSLDNLILVIDDLKPSDFDQRFALTNMLRIFAQKAMSGKKWMAVIIVPDFEVPSMLTKYVVQLKLSLPDYNKILNMIEYQQNMLCMNPISAELKKDIARALVGLTSHEIHRLIKYAFYYDGRITEQDIDRIIEAKKSMIKKNGIIEMIDTSLSFDDIGGLDRLKQWLKVKGNIFHRLDEAEAFGVDMPKGVLMVGVPGCGKSLCAKAVAIQFKQPLLKLDFGKVLGKYVGDSESNMRSALSMADAIAPCVIWIDEIEKAFSGVGGQSGSSETVTRLFGYFLTWLQEKTSSTFVIATANDITKFPPELLRKGRFDDIFFVDFPNQEERRKIFEIHIKKRRPSDLDNIDLNKLVKYSNGFSGADIEAVVKETVEEAFVEGLDGISTNLLVERIKQTVPSAVSLDVKIKDLKKTLSEYKFRPAT